jgi:hypothetical protein
MAPGSSIIFRPSWDKCRSSASAAPRCPPTSMPRCPQPHRLADRLQRATHRTRQETQMPHRGTAQLALNRPHALVSHAPNLANLALRPTTRAPQIRQLRPRDLCPVMRGQRTRPPLATLLAHQTRNRLPAATAPAPILRTRQNREGLRNDRRAPRLPNNRTPRPHHPALHHHQRRRILFRSPVIR